MENWNDPSRLCFKINTPALDKFNITYQKEAAVALLWNKYEILLYEGDYITEKHRFLPDFVIKNVMISINHLVCLGANGTVYTTRLKSKNQQKRQKSCFLPQVKNIAFAYQHSSDQCLCLKLQPELHLTIHKLNAEFECIKKIKLTLSGSNKQRNSILMAHSTIPDIKLHHLTKIFNEQNHNNSSILAFSLDSQTVHACVMNANTEELVTVNLYRCPADICGIQIIQMDTPEIIIVLKMGSIIRIIVKKDIESPRLIHLNTAVHKFTVVNNTIIYTDGCTMWQADDIFTEMIKFKPIFVKQVKDFIAHDNELICTTYNNLIYKFTLENCIEKKSDYLPAEQLYKTGLVQKAMYEIDRNDRMLLKLKKELNYISALALSNRQDLRNQLVDYSITVYEKYQNVEQNIKIILTNELHEYFQRNTVMLLIKIIPSKQWNVVEVLRTLLGSLKLHITFLDQSKILNTTSVLLDDVLNETNLLVPLKYMNYPSLDLDFVLMADLPSGLDGSSELSIILSKYTKNIASEHFIKSNKDNVVQRNLNTEDSILESAVRHHRDIFKFSKAVNLETNEYCFSVSIEGILEKKEVFTKQMNETKAMFLWKKISSEDFLNGKNKATLQIGDSKIELFVTFNDQAVPVMSIRGDDVRVLYNLRNFFAKNLWGSYENCKEGQVFVPNRFHQSLQEMEQSLKQSISANIYDQQKIIEIVGTFNKNVMSYLPL